MTGYATYAISGYYTYMHAFARTSSGGVTDLGSLPGMDSSMGYAINANGDVVGMAFLSAFGGSESVYGDPGVGDQAFLAVNGPGGYTMTDLAPPAGDNTSEAYGVNKYDMVVGGASDTLSGVHGIGLDHGRRSVLRLVPGPQRPQYAGRQCRRAACRLGHSQRHEASTIPGRSSAAPRTAMRSVTRLSSPCRKRCPATPTSTAGWTSTI